MAPKRNPPIAGPINFYGGKTSNYRKCITASLNARDNCDSFFTYSTISERQVILFSNADICTVFVLSGFQPIEYPLEFKIFFLNICFVKV